MEDWEKLLSPAQLYIILGIIATAIAIVSNRISKTGAVPRSMGLVMLGLFIASVLSVAPIWIRTGHYLAKDWMNWMLWMHLGSTILLFLIAIFWYHSVGQRSTLASI